MQCRPFRFKQRRTSVSGKKPALTGLLDGELYLNTYDGNAYFKDSVCSGLISLVSDRTVDGLNNLKFSGANSGDVPVWDGYNLVPTNLNLTGINLSGYVTTGQTGNFATVDQLSCGGVSDFFKSGCLLPASGFESITYTGLRYFDSSISDNWFNESAWYIDSGLNQNSNDYPFDFTKIVICNDNRVCVDLDSTDWVQPLSINSSAITNGTGVEFYSNLNKVYSGDITGTASFFGNSTFSGSVNSDNFSTICCLTIQSGTYTTDGINSYLVKNGYNCLCGSSNSTILNGTGNYLIETENSAIIGSSICIISGDANTLYVNNICLYGGKIYGDGSALTGISGGGGGPIPENPFHSCSNVSCIYSTCSTCSLLSVGIYNLEYNQNVLFSASIVGVGETQYSAYKLEGLIKRKSQQCEINLGCSSVAIPTPATKSIFTRSNSSYDVNPLVNTNDNSLNFQICGSNSEDMDWFLNVDLIKVIKC
jgi:hypothetical protein